MYLNNNCHLQQTNKEEERTRHEMERMLLPIEKTFCV